MICVKRRVTCARGNSGPTIDGYYTVAERGEAGGNGEKGMGNRGRREGGLGYGGGKLGKILGRVASWTRVDRLATGEKAEPTQKAKYRRRSS